MYLFVKRRLNTQRRRKIASIVAILFLTFFPFLYNLQYAHAAGLSVASNQVTDSRPSASAVNYITKWTFPGTTAIGCMQIKYTTTASGATKPTGMTTTSATKASVTGGGLTDISWTLSAVTDGTLKYTHATTQATTATAITITTANITNPSSAGVIYAQVKTYTSNDCATGLTDSAVIAFSIISGQALSVTVDPSLSFSIANLASGVTIGNGATTTVDISAATASTIPLGNVNSTTNPIVGQSLTVTTNATNGYTVYASYSGTLSDGASHTIADHTGTNGAPSAFPAAGTSAFGYQSGSSTLSGSGTRFSTNKWAKFEAWGYEVARATTKVSSDATNIGYQVGVSGTQEAGLYTTTIILTATPSY